MDWWCVASGPIVLLIKLTATSLFVFFIPHIFPKGNISVVSDENATVVPISPNPPGIISTYSSRVPTTTITTQTPFELITWERYGDSYYWFSENKLEWINSQIECINKKSGLVIINDKKELEFIHNKTQMADYYIGLTLETIGTGEKWLWIDETELDKSLFTVKPVEKDEECVSIRGGEVSQVLCNQPRHWICEKKLGK